MPPFDFDDANPADDAVVSQHPANERASRKAITDAFEVEHHEGTGRHQIPGGTTAARDAITDWQLGSLWWNTSFTPPRLQRQKNAASPFDWTEEVFTPTVITVADVINTIYPIGSLYVSTLATNPGTLLGVGTWAAFGAGRVLVGIDAGQTEFDTVEETGGAKTHALSVPEMPPHTHPEVGGSPNTLASGGGISVLQAETPRVTGSTGGGQAHNNLQPYIVVHMWKRTA